MNAYSWGVWTPSANKKLFSQVTAGFIRDAERLKNHMTDEKGFPHEIFPIHPGPSLAPSV